MNLYLTKKTKSKSFYGSIFGRVFLLELLVDKKHRNIIQWQGNEGEFIFVDPKEVASLWGRRKGIPLMNYEKMARALRHYYKGDEEKKKIEKVQGQRFVYKFVCDLKEIMGYDAKELSDMVNGVPKQPRARRYPNGYPAELDLI